MAVLLPGVLAATRQAWEAEQALPNAGHKEVIVSTTGPGEPFYGVMRMQVPDREAVTFRPLVRWESTLLVRSVPDGGADFLKPWPFRCKSERG